jgi:hypothetical protein
MNNLSNSSAKGGGMNDHSTAVNIDNVNFSSLLLDNKINLTIGRI